MSAKNRLRLFVGIAVFLLLTLAGFRLWADGLISVNFVNAPLGRVVAELQRQGHVTIRTNVSSDTLVTLQMQRVTLLDALETLAVRVNAELRAAYVVAPTAREATAALVAIANDPTDSSFSVAWYSSFALPAGAVTIDPRRMPVALEPEPTLQATLSQIAQKSGVLAASPSAWNPSITVPSGTFPATLALTKIAQAARGHVASGFLLLAERRDNIEGRAERGEGRRSFAGMNEGWTTQRIEAAIAQLPPEAQAAAKAEAESSRAFWQGLRALPEEQRREKMSEYFNSPEMLDRMNAREASRDARRTPEQRADRYKQYVERKRAASRQ